MGKEIQNEAQKENKLFQAISLKRGKRWGTLLYLALRVEAKIRTDP
jgi:hypothetical protein